MAWPSASARTKTWGTEILTAADLDGQFDVIHTWNNSAMDGSTGHDHSGGTSEGPKIVLTTSVSGTLPIANGGTGVATLAALGSLFYPIGSIYTNKTDATNPATLLGFGTWTAIADRIIIAKGSTFATAGATGGASTVTLTTTELPAHTHTFPLYSSNNGGTSGVPQNTPGPTDGTSNVTNSTGSGAAFSIMNPYVVAYVWERTL